MDDILNLPVCPRMRNQENYIFGEISKKYYDLIKNAEKKDLMSLLNKMEAEVRINEINRYEDYTWYSKSPFIEKRVKNLKTAL